jgi:hypothetical protein
VLVVRDPLRQIESISENKKIVHDMSQSTSSGDNEKQMIYKLRVNVSKFDSYFAIMKYKCISELRPVPIVSYFSESKCPSCHPSHQNYFSSPACSNQGKSRSRYLPSSLTNKLES